MAFCNQTVDAGGDDPAQFISARLSSHPETGGHDRGPLFLQGDHFQVSASLPLEQEEATVENLIISALMLHIHFQRLESKLQPLPKGESNVRHLPS